MSEQLKKSTKNRWRPKSFSVDKNDMHVFNRLQKEARSSKPRVTESSLLVQILKDYFFVKDSVRSASKKVMEDFTAKLGENKKVLQDKP